MITKENILIIGAGPAGMSCAMELCKAGKKSIIIEKENCIGGLARTFEFRESDLLFRTDIGPHRFFSKNRYLYRFIEDLLNENWISVKRQTRQFIDGKFYDYPVNATQAFKNIGPLRGAAMGFSYARGFIKYQICKNKIMNFEDYIVANFGKNLGEFNMLNYTEKIWGIPCSEIHPDWAKQRIKGLNLISAVKDALFKKKNKDIPKTLVDTFYYPKYGTGLIYDTIAEKIKKCGSIIKTSSYPTQIYHENAKITKIKLNINGKKQEITPSTLINTIPITEFIRLLSPSPPKAVVDAVKHLKWRAQVYLFVTLDKKRITNDNWIYFPNKEIPFGRVAEMKNFSKEMSPKDKTSLFIEFFVNENDKIWNLPKEKLLELSMKHFETMGLFTRKDIRNCYLLRKKNVYPSYDLDYLKHLKVIKDYLNRFENMDYIGRSGRFQYTNQDHSLEMGILAARGIIENKRYDFETVGSENEYFEKGFIRNDKTQRRTVNDLLNK